MKNSRLKTLLIGLAAGSLYSFFSIILLSLFQDDVQMSPVFIFPVFLGAISALFSTKEQLNTYIKALLLPWMLVFSFFMVCFMMGWEAALIIATVASPVFLLGAFGVFVFKFVKLKVQGSGTKLYV